MTTVNCIQEIAMANHVTVNLGRDSAYLSQTGFDVDDGLAYGDQANSGGFASQFDDHYTAQFGDPFTDMGYGGMGLDEDVIFSSGGQGFGPEDPNVYDTFEDSLY